eukprot:UN05560
MERCQIFLWWCLKLIPDSYGRFRANFTFLPFKEAVSKLCVGRGGEHFCKNKMSEAS